MADNTQPGTRVNKRGLPRSVRPDGVKNGQLFFFKCVSVMRATYQIRLAVALATSRRLTLQLVLPPGALIHKSLQDLMDQFPGVIGISRMSEE